MRYVVDTNIFNRLADGVISRNDLPVDAEFVATHIQVDEINRTDDGERRARLFLVFAENRPTIVPTESGVWGTSRLGQFKWGAGSGFTSIKSGLDALNGAKPNNSQDALIAEVALKNGYGLITADRHLAEVMKAQNGHVVFIAL